LNTLKKQKFAFLFGSLIIFFLSAFFHFLYDMTNIFLFTMFCPINESVFEHIKMIYFACLIYSVFLYYGVFNRQKSIIPGISLGLAFVYVFIPTVFYGYTSVLGTHNIWIDLLITLFSGVGFLSIVYIFASKGYLKNQYKLAIITIIILSFFTIAFTYYPPSFELFVE